MDPWIGFTPGRIDHSPAVDLYRHDRTEGDNRFDPLHLLAGTKVIVGEFVIAGFVLETSRAEAHAAITAHSTTVGTLPGLRDECGSLCIIV